MSKSLKDLGSKSIIVSFELPAAIILRTVLTSTKDGVRVVHYYSYNSNESPLL
jgi:hypothetical protein